MEQRLNRAFLLDLYPNDKDRERKPIVRKENEGLREAYWDFVLKQYTASKANATPQKNIGGR